MNIGRSGIAAICCLLLASCNQHAVTVDARAPDATAIQDAGTACTATCNISFTYPLQDGVSRVELRGSFGAAPWESGPVLQQTADGWYTELELGDREFVEYKFVLDDSDWVLDPNNESQLPDGMGNVNSVRQVDCNCRQNAFDWRDAILYFVFIDRFHDGDISNNAPVANVPYESNYQGGDLAGVIQKLEEGYFDALGVNVLWLTAPLDNADGAGVGIDGRNYSGYHGYWPKDAEAIDAHVGDLSTLLTLIDTAHARGIKVILDYVMNHVHAENRLYHDNPLWFWPNDNGSGGNCQCGDGCSWDGEQGLRCWFTDYLPDFNFTNDDARAWSVNNAIKWIEDTGADGYRLDAVKHIDSQWIYDLRRRVREEIEPVSGERFYMVGETFSPDVGLISSFVDPLTQLDGQFDFPLRAELTRTILRRDGWMLDLANFLEFNQNSYHSGAIMSTFIGNHDLPRVIHLAEDIPLFGDWDSGQSQAWNNRPTQPDDAAPYERLAMAFSFLMTTPGVPLIYYGDEIGMAGAGDPDNRRFMQWDGRNEHQMWLMSQITRLAQLRHSERVLRYGELEILSADADTIAYQMVGDGERIVVALNRADVTKTADGVQTATYTDLLTNETRHPPISLPPRSVAILKADSM